MSINISFLHSHHCQNIESGKRERTFYHFLYNEELVQCYFKCSILKFVYKQVTAMHKTKLPHFCTSVFSTYCIV